MGLRRFWKRGDGEEGRNIESNESGFADIETEPFVSAVGANKSVCQLLPAQPKLMRVLANSAGKLALILAILMVKLMHVLAITST